VKLSKKQSGIVVAVVVVVGLGVFFWQQQSGKIPDGILLSTGRIEGREVNVSSRVQGRLSLLKCDEGDTVKKGQLLAILESDQAYAQTGAAQESLNIAQRQQEQAWLDLDYSQRNSTSAIWAAQASVAQARAQLSKAVSIQQIAQRNFQRYSKLFNDGAISASEFDSRKLDYDSSTADVTNAMEFFEAAKASLETARSSTVSVDVKQKQVEVSQANVNAYRAKLQELSANQQELQIFAPIDGTIITRPVEVGQVVNAVSPLFVMINLNNIYMKIYIPESQIGKLQLGSEARIYVDAYADRYFVGKVTKISDQAQFTPKNVETKEERVKLVFAVEIAVDNPEGALKPGMPGDVVLRWKGDVPWIKPK
jgi:HlyD family secretion protein